MSPPAGDGPSILVIDNYDSFAYNLVQYVAEALASPDDAVSGDPLDAVTVRRNDAITPAGIRDLDPDGIVVSPGPGTPEEAGVSMAVFELDYPALGVCLGHQALCAANGVPVGHAPEVVHGKPSVVTHDEEVIYEGIPNPVRVGRYHSLAVERDDLAGPLVETARTDDERGVVMGVRHAEAPHEGVQFHPESILTGDPDASADAASLDVGKRMVRNFVHACTTT